MATCFDFIVYSHIVQQEVTLGRETLSCVIACVFLGPWWSERRPGPYWACRTHWPSGASWTNWRSRSSWTGTTSVVKSTRKTYLSEIKEIVLKYYLVKTKVAIRYSTWGKVLKYKHLQIVLSTYIFTLGVTKIKLEQLLSSSNLLISFMMNQSFSVYYVIYQFPWAL